MSPSTVLSLVPKLNGSNYHDWKFAVSMALRREDMWDAVQAALGTKGKGHEGTETRKASATAAEDARKLQSALTTIALTVEPTQYQYIWNCADGAEAWQALADVYEKNSRANRIALKRKFYGFKHDESAPIHHYISGITDLAARLQAIGITIDDDDLTDVLIFNLGDSWSNIAGSLTASQSELSISDIKSTLVDEEARRGSHTDSSHKDSAFAARASGPTRSESWKRTCYYCKKEGHIVRDCPELVARDKTKTPVNAGMATTDNDDLDYAF